MKRYLPLLLITIAASCDTLKKQNEAEERIAGSRADSSVIVVDVRTGLEWRADGHAPCSVNYPLDKLTGKIEALKQYSRIVLVCRSGKRAETAKKLLQSHGINNVTNEGSWQRITCN